MGQIDSRNQGKETNPDGSAWGTKQHQITGNRMFGEEVSVMAVWAPEPGDVTRRLWFQTAPLTRAGHVAEVGCDLNDSHLTARNFQELKLRVGELCLVRSEEGWLRAQVLSTEDEGRVLVRVVNEEYEEAVPADLFAREPNSDHLLPRKFQLAGARLFQTESEQSRAVSRLTEVLSETTEVRQRVVRAHDNPPLAVLHVFLHGQWWDVARLLAHQNLVTATHMRKDRTRHDLYHQHLLLLLLLRVRSKLRYFELAANFESVGSLGDMFFRYQDDNGSWVNLFIKIQYDTSDNQFILKDNLKEMLLAYARLPTRDRNICILLTNKNIDQLETVESEFLKKFEYPNIFFGNLQTITDIDIIDRLKQETKLPSDIIDNFLDNFIFATDEPNEKRLIKIVKNEINEFCDGFKMESERMYPILIQWIEEWISDNEGTYIDYKYIQEKFDSLQPTVEGIIDTVPRAAMLKFYDRIKELSLVCRLFDMQKQSQLIDIVINGPPGVGKTELALKCVESQTGKFHHIIWLQADSENSLQNDFFQLATRLKIIRENEYKVFDTNQRLLIREQIYKVLNPYKCLIIFDNAQDYEQINSFLPPVSMDTHNMFVLVTSHTHEWTCNLALSIHVFAEETSTPQITDDEGDNFSIEKMFRNFTQTLTVH